MEKIIKSLEKSTCGVCSDDFNNVYAFTKEQLLSLLQAVEKGYSDGVPEDIEEMLYNYTPETMTKQTAKDIAYLAYWGAISDESEFDNPKDYMNNLENLIQEYHQAQLQELLEEVDNNIAFMAEGSGEEQLVDMFRNAITRKLNTKDQNNNI